MLSAKKSPSEWGGKCFDRMDGSLSKLVFSLLLFQMYNVNDIKNSWGDNRIADDWIKEMIPLAKFKALKFPV